jgi:hypothetical protein
MHKVFPMFPRMLLCRGGNKNNKQLAVIQLPRRSGQVQASKHIYYVGLDLPETDQSLRSDHSQQFEREHKVRVCPSQSFHLQPIRNKLMSCFYAGEEDCNSSGCGGQLNRAAHVQQRDAYSLHDSSPQYTLNLSSR